MSKYSASLLFILVLSSLFPRVSFAQSELQKMLDETMDGDTLYIEKKDYLSDNSVTLTGRKDLILIFEKGATVTCTSQFQDIFVIQNCSGIQLLNGTFKHHETQETTNFGSGFYLFQSQNVRIYNAVIDNHGVRGLFAQSVNGLEITQCQILNNSASAFLFQEQNRNIVLKGNQYENNGSDGDEIYDFKKNASETDPFDSIDEQALSAFDSSRLDSLLQSQQDYFPKIRKAFQNTTVLKADYDSRSTRILDAQIVESLVFPAWLEHTEKTDKSKIWMIVPDSVCQYLCNATGLARFDTRDANEFFKYDEPDFTNISPNAFKKGILSDVVYLNETTPTALHWNCDPELDQMVQELKTKNKLQIAAAQETVIYRLLLVWEKYQSAGLIFEKLQFELVGKCRFMETAFNPETEMLEAQLSLISERPNQESEDIFLATMRVPLSTSVAKQLFFNRKDFSVYYKMQVHPEFKKNSFWSLPYLKPISNPIVEYMNQKGLFYKFKAYGLTGQLWPETSPSTVNRNDQNLLLGASNWQHSRLDPFSQKPVASDYYLKLKKIAYQQLPLDVRKLMKKCNCVEVNSSTPVGFAIDLNDDLKVEYVFPCAKISQGTTFGSIFSMINGKWRILDNRFIIRNSSNPKQNIDIQANTSDGFHDISDNQMLAGKKVIRRYIQGSYYPLYKPNDVTERIIKSMEDCYFGISNDAENLMEGLSSPELKDKQYLVFALESQADAEIVKTALIAKGMHFNESYSIGQIIFCYSRQLK